MARNKDNEKENQNDDRLGANSNIDKIMDKNMKRQLNNLDNLIGQSSLTLYGTDRNNDIDRLNSRFQSIINTQINDFKNKDTDGITSFMSNLVSNDKKSSLKDNIFNGKTFNISGDDYATAQSFIYDAYRNRLLEQSDLHEVSSQLIELSEAILITRDAIISADIVEGRMNRNINFENVDEDDVKNAVSIVEKMEEKFGLFDKIKNFIVPKTLEYGEYYAYIIPYSKIFQDFESQVNREKFGGNRDSYTESSVFLESFCEPGKLTGKMKPTKEFDAWVDSVYESYTIHEQTTTSHNRDTELSKYESKEDVKNDIRNMLSNIVVENSAIALPIMDEGLEAIHEFQIKQEKEFMEAEEKSKKEEENWFNTLANSKIGNDGALLGRDSNVKKKENDYSGISGCYLKLIDPTKILPLEIMDQVIGYYYVQAEDITPLGGAISDTLYYSKFEANSKESTVIDAIAEVVVKSFNKSFLEKNAKFKKLIVECLNYYNLNENRLKFQFIPVEYIQEFKIDKDENDHGTSMIKKSLFYAKLYLMILLFKIMSILLYSNDQRVNYLKSSGIDKALTNQVQEIARLKQARQINITDLFSYTTLINKVGNGSEMYIPTGRSGERPLETEILSGQDVQLNSDLLEMLKNAYILGTGVPAAIINYLNEADFAKQIEQNNTKFNGRVVNYQLDFNNYITEMYKKLMRHSTSLQEYIIDNFKFTFNPPKNNSTTTKSEVTSQFQGYADFMAQLCYDNPDETPNPDQLKAEIREFKLILAEENLPGFNASEVKAKMEKAKMRALDKRLAPNASNGDNGDDIGIDLDDENI